VNRELLERTMQYIEDHPEEHYQGMWFMKTECGTTACFAGWACLLSGLTPDFTQRPYNFTDRSSYYVKDDERWVKPIATELLGVSEDDAEILFHSANSLDELKLMVKDLLNGEHLESVHE
jgi:hypothetical protein